VELDLLFPVLLLKSLKILPLNQQTLSVPQGGQLKSQELLETGDLRNVHDDGLSRGDLIFREDAIDETMGQGFFGGEAMLQENHLCRLSATEDLWELY